MTTEPPATPPPYGPPGATFRTTRWTAVGRAKADSEEGRQALADLCEAYYEPVAAFLRCELRDVDAARDMAHEFFACLLAGDAIANADRERGRFRSYLLGAVKHFLLQRRRAARRLKRGGDAECVSINDTNAGEARCLADTGLTPDAAFDRQWALTVMARAFEVLRQECAAEGSEKFFHLVKPWLTGEAAHGDQAAVAAESGINATALKVAVHRMKRRFRQAVRAEIAGTLDEAGDVGAEMSALFAALGG